MLFFWFIWSRFFFFALNEEKPWIFFRYHFFRGFFNFLPFNFEQLNPFQKRFLGLFFTYYNFLPISFYFVDTYHFVMCRSYYSRYGYFLISQESLSYYNFSESNNLLDFSTEFKLFKKYKFFKKSGVYKYAFIRSTIFDYYFRFYMYYLQSFFELDRLEDSVFTPHSLILIGNLGIRRSNFSRKLNVYNLNKTIEFYSFIRYIDRPLINFKPKIQIAIENPIKIKFYAYIMKIKKAYINIYKKSFKVKFFLLNSKLRKALVIKYSNEAYISIDKTLNKTLKKVFFIRFSDSSVNKYIPLHNLNQYKLYFLRKNRVFNKSRYSRNRQLYRTGVYWCLWLNIIIVYGLYYFFYRFTLNFGYIWLFLFIFFFSFIFSRIFQAKLYNINNLNLEFYNFFKFVIILFSNIKVFVFNLYNNFFEGYLHLIYKKIFIKGVSPVFYNSVLYKFFLYFQRENQFKRVPSMVYIWTYYTIKDDSYWKWRTKVYWLGQLWKMLTQR